MGVISEINPIPFVILSQKKLLFISGFDLNCFFFLIFLLDFRQLEMA